MDSNNSFHGLVDIEGLKTAVWGDPNVAPSSRTITRLRKKNQIPYVKVGGLIYFSPDEVLRALSDGAANRKVRV